MKGAWEKLRDHWPEVISHDHVPGTHKDLRYKVGTERLNFLRHHAQAFAYRSSDGVETVAYLSEITEGDLDPRMPE